MQTTAKTPTQIAAFFGCTEEQARAHIRLTALQLREMGEKARRSAIGKHRGLTAEYLFAKSAAFEAAAQK